MGMPPPLIAGAALVLITVGVMAAPTPGVRSMTSTAHAEEAAAQIAWDMIALLNQERMAAGLPPLEEETELTDVAVARAGEMAASGSLSHDSPSGANAEALLYSHGVPYARMGENIARSNEAAGSVAQAVYLALMSSDRHRDNMLDPWFERIGIGVAEIGGTFYFALVFTGE